MEAQLNWQSSLLPIELTVSTSHMKENVKSSLFLLESLLHTKTPAPGEIIREASSSAPCALAGWPCKTSTQIWSLSTRGNVFNSSMSKETRTTWFLDLRHWADSLRKYEFPWNLLPGYKQQRGCTHWRVSLLLGKLPGIYQVSHLQNKDKRKT